MDSLDKTKSNYDDLKTKRTQLLADLVSTLDEKQYKIFEKYLKIDEKLRKKEMMNFAKIILRK
ncbi:MAG: hypothetical protein E7341_00185 [Clostridiales bacterium]|nr:hypothetical protein [Clostridiales bacterium]